MNESRRRYRAALAHFRRAQKQESDFRLQAQLAATILAGNSEEMTPQDAVELAYMIVHEITEQQGQLLEMQRQMLAKSEDKPKRLPAKRKQDESE